MKKNLLGILAAASAIVFSSYTAPTVGLVSFHYVPSFTAEYLYEDPTSWVVATSHPECTGPEFYVCILRVNEIKLYYYPGTNPQKLAGYLMDQGFGSPDFASATNAVENLTFSMKP